MSKPTLAERFRYWFDGWMSRGTIALMVLLGLATALMVVVLGVIVWALGAFPDDGDDPGLDDIIWGNLMRTLDPGTMGGDQGWGFRFLMLVVTIGGLIIVASLIGIISGAFDAKVEQLRKGRSRVIEKDHTLILGWSAKVAPIIRELVIANQSRRRAVIVVLADHDKVEMEEAIRDGAGRLGRTKVVCRTGDPMNLADLEIGNPHAARSIIVLAPEGSPDPDAAVVKTTLAITNNPARKPGRYHIVGELQEASSREAAKLAGRNEAHWVVGEEVIGRITVQSCRQSGLSVVYSELLSFTGNEIYFTEQPDLAGSTYFDAQLGFADSTVIGLARGEQILLNPHPDAPVERGDRLIVIAEDDSAITRGTPSTPDEATLAEPAPHERSPERTLVLGCHAGLQSMLHELDAYVKPGSEVVVLADMKAPKLPEFGNLTVTFRRGNTMSRALLDEVDVAGFDHIIVLAYRDTLGPQRADSRTLITLLQLRAIEEETGRELKIVSEMVDDRNRELAEVTNADDFIVSDKLISLVLAQVSENRQLIDVFDILFSAAGSEIYLNDCTQYVQPGVPVSAATIAQAARLRGETAIGYRISGHRRSREHSYGVVVNPGKVGTVVFAPEDRIIVLAES